MNLGLNNKVAIVAASSKGLGRACALELAKEGVNLTIFSTNNKNIKKTSHDIANETGVKILPIQADASKLKDIKKVVHKTLDEYNQVDILINNAGGPPFGFFQDFNTDDWNEALNLNLLSVINLSKEVIPHMIKQNWGRIINITSVAVKQPIDGLILSNTARAGVIGLSKSMSNELSKHNILINNVCPGRILTDRITSLAKQRSERDNTSYEEVISDMEKDIPVGRIGDPSELAALVAFLASERASYITGTTIQVDGGLIKGLF